MTATTKADLWRALTAHHAAIAPRHLRDLVAAEPDRFERHAVEAAGLFLDASRHRVDDTTLDLLVRLAEACGVEDRRDRMFAGEAVNETEGRAALHTALRNRAMTPVLVNGQDVMPAVEDVLARMRACAQAVREGAWLGYTGERFRDVVNIGIGGSDLGPAMVSAALDAWRSPHLRAHFVSNLDAAELEGVLRDLDPARTLFIVVSKTFTTQETMTNARSARRWILDAFEDEAAIARHFLAVTARPDRAVELGMDPQGVLPIWDWVGGRYSLWSAVGLSVAIVHGMETFEAMLDGAHAMDEHFRTAEPARNMPMRLALLGIWYTNFFGASSHAVLPYDHALRLLPAHLQQLEMESNGKRVTCEGAPIEGATCPVVWGGPGNNGQHAYYQLLHQGTPLVPADVIVAVASQARWADHQDAVLANALGQGEALLRGRDAAEARASMEAAGLAPDAIERLVPHKVMPGNRPSSTILYRKLTPPILGALVALYEHKVFVQSVIWGDNAFDQWGVELGKELAGRLLGEIRGEETATHDPATTALLERVRRMRAGG